MTKIQKPIIERCSCGRAPELHISTAGTTHLFSIGCRCGARTDASDDQAAVVDAWNAGEVVTDLEPMAA